MASQQVFLTCALLVYRTVFVFNSSIALLYHKMASSCLPSLKAVFPCSFNICALDSCSFFLVARFLASSSTFFINVSRMVINL